MPNPDESTKKAKSLGDSAEDTICEEQIDIKGEILPSDIFFFQKKIRKEGTIDVWWLYDDGGKFLI